MALGDIKTYTIEYTGLELQVDAIDNGDGTTQIVIKCITGYADINALYWNDGVADNDDFSLGTKKDSSLNMNGTGENWDGGLKLSSTGLGTAGTGKSTYLTEGETLNALTINYSWDTLDTIGVRATSTSNPEGSIKGVGGDPDVTEAPDISVNDPACVVEGNEVTFTISLTQAYDYDIVIAYHTEGGTATQEDDYTGTSGEITIAAGQTVGTVTVTTSDDDAVEDAHEHFTLVLDSAQVNLDDDATLELNLTANITDASGEGCIEDNDTGGGGGGPPPTDNFEDNGHDLSYTTFYFGTTEGDTQGVYDGEPTGGKNGNLPDGVYTVKIDGWPGGNGGDLDDYYDDVLAYIIANDSNVDADTEVLGVAIHAGEGKPEDEEDFYAVADNTNGSASDPYPDPPVDPAIASEVDQVIPYSQIFPSIP
jgi:hypothetical protein